MSVSVAAEKSPEAFRTISEVAAELDVPQHVLRFWESKFSSLKPLKRGGGRRYYRPDDLDLLRGIRSLLYSDGLTIKGVQKILREQGQRYVMELGRGGTTLIARRTGSEPREEESETDIEVEASNIHQFSRERDIDTPIGQDERAHFSALLDELLELKARLRSARQISELSS